MSESLTDLMNRAGLRAVDLASRARISVDTVRRAMSGQTLNPVTVYAIALALDADEDAVRAAIQAGRDAEGAA